jgi:type VI protein secretion system component Hcp
MMIADKGTGIAAEGLSEIDTSDAFTKDFVAGKFFEIEDFGLGIDLDDTDSSSKGNSQTPGVQPTKETEAMKAKGKFAKWTQGLTVSAGQGALSNMFPIQMEPFSFTRRIDMASPLMFQRCFLTKPFDTAVLVMRKTGGRAAGANKNIASIPFLRIEFKPVLIIAMDWDADEVVKEKCKFVCREITVRYRPQNHDGTLGDAVETLPLTLVKSN